jgi:cupin fold WbuC family metalloprotein
MIHIDDTIINPLVEQARSSLRRRKNFNFHKTTSDPMHRMLHGMEPETYVQPHKHENPDKREAFIILRGRVAAVEYSGTGEVIDWIILDPSTGNFGVEIQPRTWHSLIVIEGGSVVYEIKDGPWDPVDDKFFASWAPKEGDKACEEFNQMVLKKIGLKDLGV